MAYDILSRRGFIAAAGGALAAQALVSPARSADAAIEVSSIWGPDRPFQKVVDAFNAKKLGVTVTNRFDADYETAAAKALAGIAAGKPPALMTTGWKFGYFAKRTLGARDLREIDAARAEKLINQFVPAVHPLVTIDGALIGLPWAMSTPITYFNMDLWKAAGLSPDIPAQFDTDWLYARARDLDKALKGKHPTYRSALDLSNNEWTSQSFIQNAGGFIVDPSGNLALTSGEAIHGMELYSQPVREGLWIPVGPADQGAAFDGGALAITTTSSGLVPALPKEKFTPATAKFPGIPGAPRKMNSGGNFLAVYARDPEQALAAMTFLEFCASEEGQKLWSAVGYLNTSVHDIPLINSFMQPAVAQLGDGLTAETQWPGKRGLEGETIWRKWVTRMLLNQATVADAMKQAQEELKPVIAS